MPTNALDHYGTTFSLLVGQLVSFEADMRSREIPASDTSRTEASRLAGSSILQFSIGQKLISVRLDPRWLTTNSAYSDLCEAAEEDVFYAGIGTVVGISSQRVRVSALVLGKPMNNSVALFKYGMQMLGQVGADRMRTAQLSDYSYHPPKWLAETDEYLESAIDMLVEERKVTIALRFDEDAIVSGQIERICFPALLKATREIDRELSISIGSELPAELDRAGVFRARTDRFPFKNVAALVVSGFLPADIPSLHRALCKDAPPYLELVEVDLDLASDKALYVENMPLRYRIDGANLLLCCSYLERDEELLEEWRSEEIFTSVDWDASTLEEESRIAEAYLKEYLEGLQRPLDGC
jgi:hypothetical protein